MSMEVDMALVRRTVATGRAAVGVPPTIPTQGGAGVAPVPGPPPVQPGHEMAAAAPSLPAKPWGVAAGLGLAGLGALGAWNMNELAPASRFEVSDPMTIFAALLVFAAAVERVLEPFTRWMPGRREQERYEKAVADLDNGVPGAMNAVAHHKAALDSARATRGILMWGVATLVATLLAAASGFYLLRMLSADPGWDGVAVWADALVTGLVVGSGTKPLHDIINRVQHNSNVTQTPL
jgi:hypothetical protein